MYVAEVVESFLRQEPGWSENLTTDGVRIMSYGQVVGKWEQGRVILPSSQVRWSKTTARHRNLVSRVAAGRGIEVVQE
jgi:hypothetical protein